MVLGRLSEHGESNTLKVEMRDIKRFRLYKCSDQPAPAEYSFAGRGNL